MTKVLLGRLLNFKFHNSLIICSLQFAKHVLDSVVLNEVNFNLVPQYLLELYTISVVSA